MHRIYTFRPSPQPIKRMTIFEQVMTWWMTRLRSCKLTIKLTLCQLRKALDLFMLHIFWVNRDQYSLIKPPRIFAIRNHALIRKQPK